MSEKTKTKEDSPISNESFHRWKNDPVTQEVFKAISMMCAELKTAFGHPDLIMAKDGQVKAARLLGQVEGAELILNIKVDDVTEEKEDETSTVWTPDTSIVTPS